MSISVSERRPLYHALALRTFYLNFKAAQLQMCLELSKTGKCLTATLASLDHGTAMLKVVSQIRDVHLLTTAKVLRVLVGTKVGLEQGVDEL